MIDSDNIWFELAKKYNWNKEKLIKIYIKMYQISKKYQNVI